MDPSLRVECFNSENAQQCCPIVEITSNSHASNLYPEVMGTYMMSNDYQVSGRRVYHQQNGNHLVIFFSITCILILEKALTPNYTNL